MIIIKILNRTNKKMLNHPMTIIEILNETKHERKTENID
jgi:hypothetical protein